ncbi:hypothetical protein GCM10010517_50650 [Streptosporangium fragile]|uniref:Uncharacterized protein n=1 Tax=Streptosporangium fragile TaxID=46186 RepID=A0ABP6IIJ0_9ACTN
MRVFKTALVGAVALTTVGLMGLGAPAQAAEPEETIVTKTNGTSAAAQVSAQVTVRCPSGAPYVKDTEVTAQFSKPADSAYLLYKSISVSADNREAVVEFTNSRTYEEDAHERLVIFVSLTVTCSNVNHGKPAKHGVTNGMILPAGGYTIVSSTCPLDSPVVKYTDENHPYWVKVPSRGQTGRTAWVEYHNEDATSDTYGSLTAYCGK